MTHYYDPGHDDAHFAPLTVEEKKAIAALKRVAKKWPGSLWLFATGTSLNLMKVGADGKPVEDRRGGTDAKYKVTQIDIPCDGGDWP